VSAGGEPIWVPAPEEVAATQVSRFARWLTEHGRAQLTGDYLELWRWSTERLEDFWPAVWDYFDVRSATPYERVLSGSVMPDVRWFTGAQVSYVEHMFRGRDPERVALIDARESAQPGAGPVSRSLTWGMLREQVGELAARLRDMGVGPGDRVAGYVPNAAEAVIAFLATASLGAIWSGCGQDYSPAAAAERLGQLDPVVLIAADGYRYGGREFDKRGAVAELAALLPGLRATIVFPRLGLPMEKAARTFGWPTSGRSGGLAPGAMPFGVASGGSAGLGLEAGPFGAAPAGLDGLAPVAVPFSHPIWILFSSGTTGRPKGIVHGTGGVLLEHLKAMSLGLDLGERDTFFWYTSPSWMVWNYLVSALLVGTRIVCYDGSPSYPSWDTVWALAAEHHVTLLGTSPAHLRGSAQAGVEPARDHDLSALRSLGSSGSALPADAYLWAADHVGRRVRVNSTSGGTDVVSAFAGGSPIVPVWPGELSAPSLGVALDAWDSRGRPVRGAVGELVVTKPMPSMPVAFWNDPDGSRYRDAYFSTYPGVWRHGDWITITDRGSVVVHGRSDATLNRQGVRMGSSDIYHVVEQLEEIAEALVIGVERPEGEYWMPLFVVLNPGYELDDALTGKIRRAIRDGASPRHVPDEIIAVPAIPHTRTGKKLEIPVKRILQGGDPRQVMEAGAVDNPDALRWFAAYQTRTPIQ
jgi:acetoacetyl-CoA synthetase